MSNIQDVAALIRAGIATTSDLSHISTADLIAIKSDPGHMQHAFSTCKQISTNKTQRMVMGVTMSTEDKDRSGDRIKTIGWDTENFKNNPVLLLFHDSNDFPVGTVANVRRSRNTREKMALMGDEQFLDEGINPKADIAFKMVEAGALPARSVGFIPKEGGMRFPKDEKERIALDLGKFGAMFTDVELLENSIVPIPANPAALKHLGLERQPILDAANAVWKDLPEDQKRCLENAISITEEDARRIARSNKRSRVSFAVIPKTQPSEVMDRNLEDLLESLTDDETATLKAHFAPITKNTITAVVNTDEVVMEHLQGLIKEIGETFTDAVDNLAGAVAKMNRVGDPDGGTPNTEEASGTDTDTFGDAFDEALRKHLNSKKES